MQCRKRELAETSHSAKSATSEEATARLQPAKIVSGSTCTLWHIVTKMREKNADVMFLSDLSTPEWMSEGDKVVMLGTRRVHTLREWNGLYSVVWQNSEALVSTTRSKRWIGITVSMGRGWWGSVSSHLE